MDTKILLENGTNELRFWSLPWQVILTESMLPRSKRSSPISQ